VPSEGRWTFTVTSTDDEGLTSTTTRRFWVNSTLGFLRVKPRTLVVPRRGRVASITWTQARSAQVTVTVVAGDGAPVRTVARGRYPAGGASASWNGLSRSGKPVRGGIYRIRVSARNEVGAVSLERELRVRRSAVKKK
jgi:flagellar hook assembly protein FlgD